MDTLGDRVREAAKSANDTILFPISAVEIAAIGRHLDGTGDAVDAHIYREFMASLKVWAEKGDQS